MNRLTLQMVNQIDHLARQDKPDPCVMAVRVKVVSIRTPWRQGFPLLAQCSKLDAASRLSWCPASAARNEGLAGSVSATAAARSGTLRDIEKLRSMPAYLVVTLSATQRRVLFSALTQQRMSGQARCGRGVMCFAQAARKVSNHLAAPAGSGVHSSLPRMLCSDTMLLEWNACMCTQHAVKDVMPSFTWAQPDWQSPHGLVVKAAVHGRKRRGMPGCVSSPLENARPDSR